MSAGYRTIAAPVRFEADKIKGSRFVADVVPVADAATARAAVERVRTEFPDANHHVWAWRLGPLGGAYRFSDDGEPGGSAGRPVLQQIEGADLTDVAVVVTRWFGGTRLGVGGLVRAYGGTVAEALRRAEVRNVVVTQQLRLEYAYDRSTAVDRVLRSFDIKPTSIDYGATVRSRLDVPVDAVKRLAEQLRDATGGRVTIHGGDAPPP